MQARDVKPVVEKHYPGSYYDVAGLEKWLTQMAKQGWRLVRQDDTPKGLLFRQDEPAHVRFLLIPDIKRKDKRSTGELAELYAEQGWRFVCRIPGRVIVYETDDLWTAKPPVPLTEEEYDRKWRGLRRNIILWVLMVVLLVGFVIVQMLSENVTYYDRITAWPWVFALGTLFPALMCFLDVLEIYDFYAWWKHYRRQEEVKQWRAIPALRWTKMIGGWVMVGITLALPLVELAQDDYDYQELEFMRAEVPLVTLALVDEEYEPTGGAVSERSRLLIPDEIHIRTSCEVSYGNWHEMQCTYYRLRSENMAYRLAEDQAGQESWRHGAAVPVEAVGGFDALWLYEEGDCQYLTACTGDVAITIEQESGGDLMNCLPEIYDIVTEYRKTT